MVWQPGQRLQNGKYTIDRVLGAGGVGITYLAMQHQQRNPEPVVIKTLKDEIRYNPQYTNYQTRFQQDFLNEALKLAKCRHRHIVEVKEIVREGQLDGIVMEFIEGESLADRLSDSLQNRGQALPETEALRYIQQIGEALKVVHDQGFLHRDIKPQNIMIRSSTAEAVLIDFGLAREFIQNLTQTHTLGLTQGFAPPEQYNQTDKRGAYTDVYALAATLYCLLTGHIPPAAYLRLSGTTLEPPKQFEPRISDRVNQAILKGLELRAGDRPQSMQEWLTLLAPKPVLTFTKPLLPKPQLSPQNSKPQSISYHPIPQPVFQTFFSQTFKISSKRCVQPCQQKFRHKLFKSIPWKWLLGVGLGIIPGIFLSVSHAPLWAMAMAVIVAVVVPLFSRAEELSMTVAILCAWAVVGGIHWFITGVWTTFMAGMLMGAKGPSFMLLCVAVLGGMTAAALRALTWAEFWVMTGSTVWAIAWVVTMVLTMQAKSFRGVLLESTSSLVGLGLGWIAVWLLRSQGILSTVEML